MNRLKLIVYVLLLAWLPAASYVGNPALFDPRFAAYWVVTMVVWAALVALIWRVADRVYRRVVRWWPRGRAGGG